MTPDSIFLRALLAGAADLKRQVRLLNAINVFPVMDSDTGDNMSATLDALLRMEPHLETVDITAFPALLGAPLLSGARGNSGIILAQFLVGLIDALAARKEVTHANLVSAVASGRRQAFDAVRSPREGTMLTLMSALTDILSVCPSPLSWAHHADMEVRLAEAVKRTPSQLEALFAARVVDSGALGFHIMACGLTMVLPSLSDPDTALERIEARRMGRSRAPIGGIRDAIDPQFVAVAERATVEDRYCVNLLLDTPLKRDALHRAFEAFGTSINTAASGDLVKLHLHANDPEAVRSIAATLGTIIDLTIQDMAAALKRRAPLPPSERPYKAFRIVGDSSMSLSRDLASEWGISRIDHYINAPGGMLRDSDIDPDEMFGRMRAGEVFTTAQVSIEAVLDFFDRKLVTSDQIVFIAVGRAYTGTQQTVRLARERHPYRERIHVVDSVAASGQQGLIALAAAQFSACAEDIASLVQYVANQTATCREYLVIDDLTYLKRSGRIGNIKAALASALLIKPIVGHGPSGAVTYAKTRSGEAALAEITRRTCHHPGSGPFLIMVEHTDNEAWALQVARHLADTLPAGTEIHLAPLSSSSAVHMGPGTWGVAVTRK